MNAETFENKLKAFSLAALLAKAEADLVKGRVRPAREFIKNLLMSRKYQKETYHADP